MRKALELLPWLALLVFTAPALVFIGRTWWLITQLAFGVKP